MAESAGLFILLFIYIVYMSQERSDRGRTETREVLGKAYTNLGKLDVAIVLMFHIQPLISF